jgi:hypothetical protein
MSETAIVSSAPDDLHDGVRMSTTSERGSLLQQLRAAYQGLGREERLQVKSLMLTLSRSNSNLLCRKDLGHSNEP